MTTKTERITGTDRYDQEHADRHGFTKEAVQAAQDALDGDDYAILGHIFPGAVTDTEWVLAHRLVELRGRMERHARTLEREQEFAHARHLRHLARKATGDAA